MAIDREKTNQNAQKLVEKKKYDKAILEYQKIIQEDPNDARTLLKIGDCQAKMEAYAEAAQTYEKVGKFYASQGFALKAIAVYKQIREIVARHLPSQQDRFFHIVPRLAELYQQLGLTSDALATFDEVAYHHQKNGRDPEAIEVFRKIVELDPSNPLPHLRLAEALSRNRDVDGAVVEFGIASTQLVKLNRRDDALKVLERLLHHKPDPIHARIAAELYLARNQPNDGLQALAKLQICFQANPKELDTLSLLSRAFHSIGQAQKAFEVQKEMARLAHEQGRHEIFGELVTKLVRIAPQDETVRDLEKLAKGIRSETPAPLDGSRTAEHDSLSPPPDEPLATGEAESLSQAAIGIDIEGTLADALRYRQEGRIAEAVELLLHAIEQEPRSVELRIGLRDAHLEGSSIPQAVEQMLVVASLQIDALDGDAAAQTLQEALELDPENARAADLLRELGYELVEEETTSVVEAPAPVRPPQATFDPEAPLPSYDLEEIGPEDVAPQAYSEPPMLANPRLDEIDDPFDDAPLPSFPLDRGEAATSEAEEQTLAGEPPRPEAPSLETSELELLEEDALEFATSEMDAEAIARRSERPPTEASLRAAPEVSPELEEVLEEAEFFASRGLYSEARELLSGELARLPGHPLLIDRLSEIAEQERAAGGESGAREMPKGPVVRPTPPPPSLDRAFDIAAALSEMEEEVPTALANRAKPSAAVDVEAVFAQFKAGVAKQVAVDDGQTHYDLGVAYKEMGYVDDAVREFEVAARDAKCACISHAMIGMLHLERGNVDLAIEAFQRGLASPVRDRDQELALCFEIGAGYEQKGKVREALDFFGRVHKLDPTYRDVGDRIARLEKPEAHPKSQASKVTAEDDFDRAFDDILAGGKK